MKLIDKLLQNNLVISIQEHISPARDDGRRQTPNIYDDKLSLIKIFSYLHDKNVWFCTCSELASYVYYRDNLKLTIENDTFEFNIKELKDYKFKNISIKSDKYNKIITPKGKVIKEENGVLNIPIEYGKYKLKRRTLVLVSLIYVFKQVLSANLDLFYILSLILLIKSLIKKEKYLIKLLYVIYIILFYTGIQIIFLNTSIDLIRYFVSSFKLILNFNLLFYIIKNKVYKYK